MLGKIKEERERAGLSQDQMADVLGVHKNTVSGWEKGNFEPTSKNVVQLATLFGCSADYLLGVSDEREPKDQL